MFQKSKKKSYIRSIIYAVLIIIFLHILFFAINWDKDYIDNQEISLIEQSIKKAVINCYAIEGVYPQDIEYIEKNYGVSINHDKYVVDYQIFAPNILPDIEVVPKGKWYLDNGGDESE